MEEQEPVWRAIKLLTVEQYDKLTAGIVALPPGVTIQGARQGAPVKSGEWQSDPSLWMVVFEAAGWQALFHLHEIACSTSVLLIRHSPEVQQEAVA